MSDYEEKKETMMTKKVFVAWSLAPFAVGAADTMKIKSPVEVTRVSQPEKALKFGVVGAGKPAEVWQAFTTSAGLDTWLWQDCTADLREGGDWIVHFPGG